VEVHIASLVFEPRLVLNDRIDHVDEQPVDQSRYREVFGIPGEHLSRTVGLEKTGDDAHDVVVAGCPMTDAVHGLEALEKSIDQVIFRQIRQERSRWVFGCRWQL
jgi:hypothetical protein